MGSEPNEHCYLDSKAETEEFDLESDMGLDDGH